MIGAKNAANILESEPTESLDSATTFGGYGKCIPPPQSGRKNAVPLSWCLVQKLADEEETEPV